MDIKQLQKFEKALAKRGYKRITSAKAEQSDDYEYYKAFKDEEGELKYQIFFEFWDWEQFRIGDGYSVSVTIIPESTKNNVGRRDLKLSVDWATNIVRVEICGEEFYNFIRRIDKF